MIKRIDLNCDLGEGYGAWSLSGGSEILPYISSVNVACGYHAGDPRTMRDMVEAAKQYGVTIGAHPSYPDRVGFGRRNMDLSMDEIMTDIWYQLGSLAAFCRLSGVPLVHVKPHGALYNRAMVDTMVATATAEAVWRYDSELILVAQPESKLLDAGTSLGLRMMREVFADRAYHRTGRLVSRSQLGAVIHDPSVVAARAVQMATTGRIQTVEGDWLDVPADTICVHGDTPAAVTLVAAIVTALKEAGVEIEALS